MEDRANQRVKLWLRSERAFGLESVVFRDELSAVSDEVAPPTFADASASAARSSPASSATTLFGAAETESAPTLMPSPSVESFAAPELSRDDKRKRLIALDSNEVRDCKKCRLCETRTNTVFGEGDPDAKIFFIGEGPGQNEDETGRPFVGRAGQLLDKMIAGMGLKREQVYIANIVKCRPPGNREPAPDETATCTPYLQRQLEIVRPKVIVTLGRPSTCHMLQLKVSMNKVRGQWQSWRGIKLMPTFHPAYVLRNPTYETRAAVWSDLKQVLVELGMPIPKQNKVEQA